MKSRAVTNSAELLGRWERNDLRCYHRAPVLLAFDIDSQPVVRLAPELPLEQKRGFAIQRSLSGDDLLDEFGGQVATLDEFGNRQFVRFQMHLEHLAGRSGIVRVEGIGWHGLYPPWQSITSMMGLMEWLLPSLQGRSRTSGLVSRGIRGVRKGLNGLLVRPMLGGESTGAARAGVADRRRNETRGSWSSTSDALPGTEFAEGVAPEADSGEFRTTYGATDRMVGFGKTISQQRTDESSGLIWTRSQENHNGPRPRRVASRGLTHVRTIRRLDKR